MPTIEDLIERLPDDTQKTVRSLWETLPDTDRASIKNLVEGFPSQTNLWRLLVRLSTNQIKYVPSPPPPPSAAVPIFKTNG